MAEKRVKTSPVNINFTSEEDCFLKKGIEKYGKGAWSRILRDPQLHFNANRSRDSLRMRADICAFRTLRNNLITQFLLGSISTSIPSKLRLLVFTGVLCNVYPTLSVVFTGGTFVMYTLP